eukprot:scaffold248426_cov79-Cyclotella_meneghiniana.AAC.3
MEVGQFARAYVAQKSVDYELAGKDYGDIDGLDYVDCTGVYYNDVQYYAKLGCATTGGLRISTYSDEYCTHEINTNLGIYNDIKATIGLTWIVLKQRRHMSREDAIVEEAAMQGVGLKKRHVFPIALGIIILTILSMFMVWKKLSWLLLIGANLGLFAHFMYLRRKAKRASAGSSGYMKDGGLEIS